MKILLTAIAFFSITILLAQNKTETDKTITAIIILLLQNISLN